MPEYIQRKTVSQLPRIPVSANIDPTYRCNLNCRHCWLKHSPESDKPENELTVDEIRSIVDQSRKLGCRHWSISGGEPMLRPDFPEIFDCLTRTFSTYTLNTNGTLITSEIARLLVKKGNKMVSLYGATAEVHDHITRRPGSFDALMSGIERLKSAGAGFTVQIVPMRDNFHQLEAMKRMADTLSPHSRVGAAWLYLTAGGNEAQNREIERQRLSSDEVTAIDAPDPFDRLWGKGHENDIKGCAPSSDDTLFSECIDSKRDFHIDPLGRMTFCGFVKVPEMRYDLRSGTVQDAWDNFIPSLAEKIQKTDAYRKNCGGCHVRSGCRWCPVYAYLEHGSLDAKIEYLCELSNAEKRYRADRKTTHARWYRIGGVSIGVLSDLPITEDTFQQRFKAFEAKGPEDDTVLIRHHFSLPDLSNRDLGNSVYHRIPWAIYRNKSSWIYTGITDNAENGDYHRVSVVNDDYSRIRVFNPDDTVFLKGNLHSLSLFPTDQILLAHILAYRDACFMHACGVIMNNKGLLFVGHSDAGKSTTVTQLKHRAEILCDDRIIIRKWPDGFHIHGTWNHGDVPLVSSASAPLAGIFFLEQSGENRIIELPRRSDSLKRLLACLIRPLQTRDWWNRMFTLMTALTHSVPCYRMQFDKSGRIVDHLERLL